MLNQKVLEVVKRQTELAGVVATGKATEAQKTELLAITEKLEQLTGKKTVSVGKTKLTTMTLKEFKAHIEAEQVALQTELDPARLALLKRNIEAVKSQGKTAMDDVVAVELAIESAASDARMDAMEEKLDQVLTALKDFDGRTQTGVGDADGDGDDGDDGGKGAAAKGDGKKPTAEALANEALDAIIKRFQAIKEKIAAGEISTDDLEKMWPGWEMREMLEGAVAVLAKLEEAKGLVEEVMPALEKAAKGDDGDDGDDDDDDDDDDKKKKKTSKGGAVDHDSGGAWGAGGDLSPKLSDKDAFTSMKKASTKSL